MGRQHRLLITVALALTLAMPLSLSLHQATAATQQCFPETGHCIQAGFLAYWQANGGLARFGYPLSDEGLETLEDGRAYTVQYFERVRMEYHPENQPPYDVLLGQFGRDLHPADPSVPPSEGAVYFAATGHNLGAGFLAYWQANGGLTQFGYPLSEEIQEQLEDGQAHTVQYFERARFEYHPENQPPYDVLLGQFGRRFFAASFLAPFPGQPPVCHAADLTQATSFSAAAGSVALTLTLTNTGAIPCTLSGTPQITLVDDSGQPLAVPVSQHNLPAGCSGGPQDSSPCPAQWAIALPPGGRSETPLQLSNYCAPPAGPPLSVQATLPGNGGQRTSPVQDQFGNRLSGTGCIAPGQPAEILVMPLSYLGIFEPAFSGVIDYYGFINGHSYQLAYNMLSPALQAQQPYDQFVAGYATTTRDTIAVEMIVPTGDQRWTVTVRLAARQTDGSVRFFRGTYDIAQVPMGGAPPGTKTEQIVGADIRPE